MKNTMLFVFGTLMVLFGTTTVLLYLKVDDNMFTAAGALPSTFIDPSSSPPNPPLAKKYYRGQIFIVTRGGESVPLGGVIVSFYTHKQFQEVLPGIYQKIGKVVAEFVPVYEAKVKAFNASWQAYEKINATKNWNKTHKAMKVANEKQAERIAAYYALHYISSAQAYANALPKPYVTAQTAADGKFNLEASAEPPLVATACATRQLGEKTENYCWFITMDGSKEILLNNHNTFGRSSSDSAIPMPELPIPCQANCEMEVEAIKDAYALFSTSLTPQGSLP
ncbi:hypothetical protein AN403_5319 [Pseudomonas fluorescens]|uniref:Uncharacterized protein n=1 Tax=Pseudomonas fluorescens TaxID=294 RepID=A0A0P8XVG6_PSEFL|nr:hypothetical protein [Pseudomonas fluorescens]KPU61307.1 hypothetical protein AN403_5319 [Pseudomonas fluorescens]